jgi:hypothetical protein
MLTALVSYPSNWCLPLSGRDLLYKYFGQLELLELRFPEVRVPFPW